MGIVHLWGGIVRKGRQRCAKPEIEPPDFAADWVRFLRQNGAVQLAFSLVQKRLQMFYVM